MKTWIIILCIVVAIFVITLPSDLRIRRNMRRYWDRACTGLQWRRRFPNAPKSDIRSFLELFVHAFAFRSSQRLCFSPDDKIMEIYCTLYPGWILTDVEELETLTSLLRKKYGIDATTFWREDITLGELFTHTRVT